MGIYLHRMSAKMARMTVKDAHTKPAIMPALTPLASLTAAG